MDSYNNPSNKKKKVAIIVFLLLSVAVLSLVISARKKPAQPSAPVTPIAGTQPSPDILLLIGQYLQAREDSVGADQATSTTWLATVKPTVTSAFLDQLQPLTNPSTSSVSSDFTTAHNSGYIIKTSVDKCIWTSQPTKPTTARGSVFCALNDTTIDQKSGAVVAVSGLPFGWVHSGNQSPPTLDLVKQNGHWLISGDSTGSGQ